MPRRNSDALADVYGGTFRRLRHAEALFEENAAKSARLRVMPHARRRATGAERGATALSYNAVVDGVVRADVDVLRLPPFIACPPARQPSRAVEMR